MMAGSITQSHSAAARQTELTRCTVVELVGMIRRKEVSSLEVVDACLERIRQVNPRLNAVVTLVAEDARTQARVADQKLARGEAIGALHGIPMTIKDSLDTAGVITTAGTMGRKNFLPKEDATVVKRLKSAGAILLGKTNTPELTCAWETNNSVFGATNNPWNLKYSSGGSSGGAGAIVAAQGVPFDIGSDTGGSIRLPSYFCGIAGLKPTSGRVPRTGHVIGPEGHLQALTTLGPMARSVEDLSLILSVIAGPDWRDASVVPMALGDPSHVKVSGLRVAMHAENGAYTLHPEVAKVVIDAAKALENSGVQIEFKRPAALDDVIKIDADLYSADGSASLQRILDQSGTKDPSPLMLIALKQTPMTSGNMAAAIERWDA